MLLPCCFVLGLLSSTAWAQVLGSTDLRVARQLTAAGLSYNIDGNGGYRIPNFLYRQSATLSPQPSSAQQRMFSLDRTPLYLGCSCSLESSIPSTFPCWLLRHNVSPKLGSWSIASSDTTPLPVSSAVLPAEASLELLKTVIVSATADEPQTYGASGSVPSSIHS